MTVPSSSRIAALALLVAAASWATGRGDDPASRLAPVEGGASPLRVDPRPARLSAAERARLYDEVARDAEPLERQARQLRRLVTLLKPSVVHIDASKPLRRPRSGRTTENEAGSGVIVRLAGRDVVLTNRHVIDKADLDAIKIRLDDSRELLPRRAWSDAGTDIAVLEIEADDLAAARLADKDTVQIGDLVLAIGSPFGLAQSVTLGIVSAKGRRDLQMGSESVRFQDFIQTDAAINPGNSGGPLVNLRGEVVALTTAIASNSGGNDGIAFAIPIEMVKFVVSQLVEHGTVPRAYLGVALDRDFTATEADRLGMVRPVGARVEGVTANAPAAEVGIRPDDVILEFDGRAIEDDDHLMSVVGMTLVEQTVKVVLLRNRQRVELDIPVGRRTDFE